MKYRAHPYVTVLLVLAVAAWQCASAQLAKPAAKPQDDQPAQRTRPPAQPNARSAGGTAAGSSTPARSAATPPARHKRYYIEIVIFRAQVALGSPEDWQAETGMARTVAGGEAVSGSSLTARLLERLPPSRYRLTSIAQTLSHSHTYTVVAHAAWEQTASAWGNDSGFTLRQLGIDVPGLSGQVYFERGQFLHLGMTLDYTMQHPPKGLGADPGTQFVLNEIRRVRFYRRNYYDNPAFGVIALVLPVRGTRPPGR